MSDASDPLLDELRRLAAAGNEAGVDRELGRLLGDEAAPLLTRAIRAQMSDLEPAEREEVHGDALLRLTVILQRFAAGDPSIRIESFRAYVAATAVNGCRALLRSRHPERTRLSNQLRYVLRQDAAFATWEEGDGVSRCGLAAWRERGAPAAAMKSRAAGGQGDFAVDPSADREALPQLLRRYFLWKGRPVAFGELTAELADQLGVRDLPPLSLAVHDDDEDDAPRAAELASDQPGADREVEDREFLARLWAEVVELPPGQRVALLLNLRDLQGRDRLRLFPVTGVATLADLARALDLAPLELERLLPELPLEDRAIADRLALTQRQVINLRKSARARLARRLARELPARPAAEEPRGGR